MDVVFDNTPTRVSSMGHRHIYARVNRSDCYVHRCPTDRGWRRHRPPESFAQAPKATASSAIATYGLLRFWAQNQGRRRTRHHNPEEITAGRGL
jgi:hypothetical protein